MVRLYSVFCAVKNKCLYTFFIFFFLDDEVAEDDVDADETTETVVVGTGVPDPYYPIALPIDQAFKAKYVFHHRRGKTFQERLYVFLEHPGGWLCFIYHFTV